MGSGEDALHAIQNLPKIDLLWTDFNLGGHLDGLDMARAMRIRNAQIPILLVTASDVTLFRIRELLLISNTVLLKKSFSQAELGRIIDSFVTKKLSNDEEAQQI